VARRPPARKRARNRVVRVARIAEFDRDRGARTGAPEIVLAEGKRPADLVALLTALAGAGHAAFVSRLEPHHLGPLARAAADGRLPIAVDPSGRFARLEGGDPGMRVAGRVAIVTAGTADGTVADEAEALLRAYGVTVSGAFDVGVAGLHRLTRAARRLERSRPRVYLAFAGREGALPTVLAGLVRAPVIGIPTSTGYGRGGRGEAALAAMLQSCAPIAVVNIDGAVPAALFALQLLAGDDRAASRR